jgi:hypothetical protein
VSGWERRESLNQDCLQVFLLGRFFLWLIKEVIQYHLVSEFSFINEREEERKAKDNKNSIYQRYYSHFTDSHFSLRLREKLRKLTWLHN